MTNIFSASSTNGTPLTTQVSVPVYTTSLFDMGIVPQSVDAAAFYGIQNLTDASSVIFKDQPVSTPDMQAQMVRMNEIKNQTLLSLEQINGFLGNTTLATANPAEVSLLAGLSQAQTMFTTSQPVMNMGNPFQGSEYVAIGDTDNDSKLSPDELKLMSSYIDIDRNNAISQYDIELAAYIARKDGRNGLSFKERDVFNQISNGLKAPLTPDLTQYLKTEVDRLYNSSSEQPTYQSVKQLFSDGKIETTEYSIIERAYTEWVATEATQGRIRAKTLTEAKASQNDLRLFALEAGLTQNELSILTNVIPALPPKDPIKTLFDDGKLDSTEIETLKTAYAAWVAAEVKLGKNPPKTLEEAQKYPYVVYTFAQSLNLSQQQADIIVTTKPTPTPEPTIQDLFKDGKLDSKEIEILEAAYAEWVKSEVAEGKNPPKTLEEAQHNYVIYAFAKSLNLTQQQVDIIVKTPIIKSPVNPTPSTIESILSDGKINDSEYKWMQTAYAEWVKGEVAKGLNPPKTLEEAKNNVKVLVAFSMSLKLSKEQTTIFISAITNTSSNLNVDLNLDGKVDAGEVSFFRHVETLDGKTGFNAAEAGIIHQVKQYAKDFEAKYGEKYDYTDPKFLKDAKAWATYSYNNADVKPLDLNKNTKIDDFERDAAVKFGIDTKNSSTAQIVNIADSNGDNAVSEHEFNAVKGFLNINPYPDGKASKSELALVEYISQLGKKDGIEYPETIVLSALRGFFEQAKKDGKPVVLNEKNQADFQRIAKAIYDWIDKGPKPQPKPVYNYNFNFDAKSAEFTADFEKLDNLNKSPNNNRFKRAAMQGYLSEFLHKFPNVPKSEVEELIGKKKYAEINLKEFKEITSALHTLASKASAGQDLYKGTVPAPEISGEAHREVPVSEFNAVISGKLPLAKADMNYSFDTGPADYTKKLLDVLYAYVGTGNGKVSEAEAKKRYDAIITEFRKSGHKFSQHPVTPWDFKK